MRVLGLGQWILYDIGELKAVGPDSDGPRFPGAE